MPVSRIPVTMPRIADGDFWTHVVQRLVSVTIWQDFVLFRWCTARLGEAGVNKSGPSLWQRSVSQSDRYTLGTAKTTFPEGLLSLPT